MKTLVIGGTSNLGLHISKELIANGCEILTLSRAKSGLKGYPHFECDIADQSRLDDILEDICSKYEIIDNVYCVAGYAEPTKLDNQNEEVARTHMIRNVEYVKLTVNALHKALMRGENPFIVTLGSQWSYRSPLECPELIPYANAKRALRECSDILASTYSLRVNHYCIPTTDTLTMRKVETDFRERCNKNLVPSHVQLANPKTIAHTLVNHSMKFKEYGKTLLISPEGSISVLERIS